MRLVLHSSHIPVTTLLKNIVNTSKKLSSPFSHESYDDKSKPQLLQKSKCNDLVKE